MASTRSDAVIRDVLRSPWPFDGLFGDGSDGAISGTQTATKMVVQATDFTLTGHTYTAKQQNPGGLLLAVRGTLTMDATSIIDANGQGALGGSSQTSATAGGFQGAAGKGFAGRGGGGGGDGTRYGASAGPVLMLPVLASSPSTVTANFYNQDQGAAVDGWTTTNATTIASLGLLATYFPLTPAVVGTVSTGTAGAAPSSTQVTPFFDWLMTSGRLMDALGYGSGGGSGANLSGNSGAGGKGGGFIFIVANTLNLGVGAILRAAGNAGSAGSAVSSGGGGGGGGGSIVVFYKNLILDGATYTVSGGAAGALAGIGANGGAGALGFSTTRAI